MSAFEAWGCPDPPGWFSSAGPMVPAHARAGRLRNLLMKEGTDSGATIGFLGTPGFRKVGIAGFGVFGGPKVEHGIVE